MGKYIECDYRITDLEEEAFRFRENSKIRKECGIPDGEFYHYDTPCTIENQISMFHEAGFCSSEMVWRQDSTTIIVSSHL